MSDTPRKNNLLTEQDIKDRYEYLENVASYTFNKKLLKPNHRTCILQEMLAWRNVLTEMQSNDLSLHQPFYQIPDAIEEKLEFITNLKIINEPL